MKPSLLSAIAGWLAGSVSFIVVWGLKEGVRDLHEWLGLLLFGAIYSAPIILFVWLIALWPLYIRVPLTSPLWRPVVCVLSGAVAGALIYFLIFRFVFAFPQHALRSFPHLIVGAAAGAAACAAGSRLKRRESAAIATKGSGERPSLSNLFHSSGANRAERDRLT